MKTKKLNQIEKKFAIGRIDQIVHEKQSTLSRPANYSQYKSECIKKGHFKLSTKKEIIKRVKEGGTPEQIILPIGQSGYNEIQRGQQNNYNRVHASIKSKAIILKSKIILGDCPNALQLIEEFEKLEFNAIK